tara:strand:- start:414 stop:692 length:279 start_codon:yes stop_codon:yes gene_type:complete
VYFRGDFMAKKKTHSWEDIGEIIKCKVKKDVEKENCRSWQWQLQSNRGGHFFGALLFAIVLSVILNQEGMLLEGVKWWLQALLVFGFAMMFN